MNCSLLGSSVHGISQARILEWVAMPSSRRSSQPRMDPTSPALAGRSFYHWATAASCLCSFNRTNKHTTSCIHFPPQMHHVCFMDVPGFFEGQPSGWFVTTYFFPDLWTALQGYLLLLLSHFSHVWLCATPQMEAHQAPLSLGSSRQEHWSGLPFPSPIHENEKWKWSRSVVSDS